MHMHMIASSIKIININKRNVFAMYWFKSGFMLNVETYMCILGLWFANIAAA